MSRSAQWDDLAPRLAWGLAMAVVGGALVYVGGWPFRILVWALCGVMIWELARMFAAPRPVGLGVLNAFALALAELLPAFLLTAYVVLPLLVAAVLTGAGQVQKDRGIYALYALVVLAGCFAILLLRGLTGLEWFVWLVAVVIASDIAGYFAGRMLGGPKFWPRVSPKKTWSGTIAGWLAAGLLGLGMGIVTGYGLALVPVAVLTAFAGQMGDIAESAVKRRAGVKDSSALIPGHGGVLDRFDAMLGAALFLFVLMLAGIVPGIS